MHLADIHLEKGMHCIDCHFTQDAHGNGKLYGETRNAIEIGCVDCHGTIERKAMLTTSGPASAKDASSNMLRMRTPFKEARFVWRDGKLYQRSNVEEHKEWEIVQVLDTITPGNEHYSEKIAAGEDAAGGWRDVGAYGRHEEAGAQRPADDVPELPFVVDDFVLRLPSFDDGEPEDADAAQRGRDDAELDGLQLPGAAR